MTEREKERRGRETTGIERVSRLSGRGGGDRKSYRKIANIARLENANICK